MSYVFSDDTCYHILSLLSAPYLQLAVTAFSAFLQTGRVTMFAKFVFSATECLFSAFFNGNVRQDSDIN